MATRPLPDNRTGRGSAGGRTSLNRSASVLVAEGQPARLLGLIDSTSALRERQSNRPNHAAELRQQATGHSLTAKPTAKW
jgi:hypothetical protein